MKPAILILAAGFATRYGSLKQIDRFGPTGESLIDYTVYDAIRAGFGKAVFVIRDSIADTFRQVVTDKFSDRIEVSFVSQEITKIPPQFNLPLQREKPWGTGHAVLVAEPEIDEPFVAVNADDFYGFSSFESMYTCLAGTAPGNDSACYSMGYRLENTLTEHGHVSRAICEIDEAGFLRNLTEVTRITGLNGRIEAVDSALALSGDTVVSMNMFGFRPAIFNYLKDYFTAFLEKHIHNNTVEFYLPAGVSQAIQDNLISVKVLPTEAAWFGVTYKEDKQPTTLKIRKLIESGLYPEDLWR